MKTLIVGAGIAGLTLAERLLRLGQEVELVEVAPHLRAGGYMIDFFGPGYDVAERMGLLPALSAIHYPVSRLSFVDRNGHEVWGLDYARTRQLWFGGRHFNFLRGDLVSLLHRRIEGRLPIRFSHSIATCVAEGDRVAVTFSDGRRADYDLVVGADGVNSRVRDLVFDEARRISLGYQAAAFVFEPWPGEIGDLPPDLFASLSVVGRQVSVYPIRDGRLATFFLHTSDQATVKPGDPASLVHADLQRIYGDLGWVVPAVLRACPPHGLYFDDVAQIELPRWHRDRVVLLGDACGCVSLVAGQGASLAMLGAQVLSEELEHGAPDMTAALRRYEERMLPVVASKQKAGRRMAGWFAPKSRARIALRDGMMRLASRKLFSPLIRRQLIGAGQPVAGAGS